MELYYLEYDFVSKYTDAINSIDTGGTWYDIDIGTYNDSINIITVSFYNCKRTKLSASISGTITFINNIGSGSLIVQITGLPTPDSAVKKIIDDNKYILIDTDNAIIFNTRTSIFTGSTFDFSIVYYIKQ